MTSLRVDFDLNIKYYAVCRLSRDGGRERYPHNDI